MNSPPWTSTHICVKINTSADNLNIYSTVLLQDLEIRNLKKIKIVFKNISILSLLHDRYAHGLGLICICESKNSLKHYKTNLKLRSEKPIKFISF